MVNGLRKFAIQSNFLPDKKLPFVLFCEEICIHFCSLTFRIYRHLEDWSYENIWEIIWLFRAMTKKVFSLPLYLLDKNHFPSQLILDEC